MTESASFSDVNVAFGLLPHLYPAPVLVALIRGGVPDQLDEGSPPATDLAQRAGLDSLSLTRALRAFAQPLKGAVACDVSQVNIRPPEGCGAVMFCSQRNRRIETDES